MHKIKYAHKYYLRHRTSNELVRVLKAHGGVYLYYCDMAYMVPRDFMPYSDADKNYALLLRSEELLDIGRIFCFGTFFDSERERSRYFRANFELELVVKHSKYFRKLYNEA